MPREPAEIEDENPFRPPWETDELTAVNPLTVNPKGGSDIQHPLLAPLARAQDALARLETAVELASPAVTMGLRARLSYREAAGWLAHAHIWVHPHDLALRDRGLTNSYGAAFNAGRLAAEIPTTAAHEPGFDNPLSDIATNQALQLARLWRRLAEMRTWRPLTDTATLGETLRTLGCRVLPAPEIDDWLAIVSQDNSPALIRGARAARDWMNRPNIDPRDLGGVFLAACLIRDKKLNRPIALPFWSAPDIHHHRRDLRTGIGWLAGFLDCVATAAKIGLEELGRLRQAEDASGTLSRTARSQLPNAMDAFLRMPIVTARDLAETLAVSPQSALALIRHLKDARIIQEATGRQSWRAYVLAPVLTRS